jgi:putative membrane protein
VHLREKEALMKLAIALSAALLFPAAALAQAAGENQLTPADKQFMEQAAQLNMTEAHLGRMAQEKGSGQAIKDFGETLQEDHTKAYGQLSSLADEFQFEIPKGIDQEHQKIIQQFQGLSGPQFDEKFIEHQRQEHQKALELFQREAQRAQDPKVQAYARQMASLVEKHSQMAQNLPQPGAAAAAGEPANGESTQVHGTVTKYEPGKVLEMQLRDRVGRYSYDLSQRGVDAEIPGGIEAGSQVVVTERVDPNGRQSIAVRQESGAPAGQ